MDLFGDLPPAGATNGEIKCFRIRNINSVNVDSNSASLFDDIPPAADKNDTSGKRKVEDENNDDLKRPKLSTQKCAACT